jgi:hypothetical protein
MVTAIAGDLESMTVSEREVSTREIEEGSTRGLLIVALVVPSAGAAGGRFYRLGLDRLFSDNPDTAVAARTETLD